MIECHTRQGSRIRLKSSLPVCSQEGTLRQTPLSCRSTLETNLGALDGDGGGAAGEVALGGDDLVVVLSSESHAGRVPCVEVAAHGDGAAAALGLADGPELVEVLSVAVDGGGVGAAAAEEAVNATVAGDAADAGGAARGVVGAKVLDDVVLNQRVAGPAVDGEVAVAVGPVVGGVPDGSKVVDGLLARNFVS